MWLGLDGGVVGGGGGGVRGKEEFAVQLTVSRVC